MHRIVVPPNAIQNDKIVITDAQTLHHLIHVLRVRIGEELICTDGRGSLFEGRVSHISSEALTVLVERASYNPSPGVRITLAQALIKAARFEWLIQKATELGVERIVPLVTDRTVIRPEEERQASKQQRWQRIAQEATAQCGRSLIPVLEPIRPYAEFLRRTPLPLTLIATLVEGTRPLKEVLKETPALSEVVLLIGPEGDFSPQEVTLALEAKAIPVSLGPLTLRAETAALAAMAIVRYAAGDI